MSVVIIVSAAAIGPYGKTLLQECFFGGSDEFCFWSQFKIQYGCKSQWCNLIGWTFKLCCSITTKVVWNLIVVNNPGVLLYKVCYFSADRKSKMAATARMVIWLMIPYKVGNFNMDWKWVLIVTFKNILVILWGFLYWRKTEYPEKMTDLLIVTNKCHELVLSTLPYSGIKLTKLIVTNYIGRCTFVFPTNISSWPQQK